MFFKTQTSIHQVLPSPGREFKTVRVSNGMGPKELMEIRMIRMRILGVPGAHFLEYKIVILWFDLPSSLNEDLKNVPLYLISSREKGRKEA